MNDHEGNDKAERPRVWTYTGYIGCVLLILGIYPITQNVVVYNIGEGRGQPDGYHLTQQPRHESAEQSGKTLICVDLDECFDKITANGYEDKIEPTWTELHDRRFGQSAEPLWLESEFRSIAMNNNSPWNG